MYEAGKTEEISNRKGLAFTINKNLTDYVKQIEKHPDGIISCKIKLQLGKTSLQIIQVHGPKSDHDDETVEMFYQKQTKQNKTKKPQKTKIKQT